MSPHLLNASMLTWAGITFACALGTLIALIALRRLHVTSHIEHRTSNILLDDSGTATIEFALVLPILGFMVMAMTQTVFLMAGNLFVNYAAFAATRAAIVQIPAEYADDPANQFTATPGRTKYDAIQHAAAFALVPVAGRQTSSSSNISTAAYVSGLASFYSAYSVNQPPWINSLAADRLRFALDNTTITVMTPQVSGPDVTFIPVNGGAAHKFQPRDPITVMVAHRLNLSVPYISAIFADGNNASTSGGGGGGGRYRLMTARYTLSNEGITDAMPPTPTIPRITP
ncbi:MAG: TadE family protein [Phycisphaeraceae bacterium]